MAIPKKGSRKIVVDDVIYRWRIRWKPTHAVQDYFMPGLLVTVEFYDDPQSILYIGFLWSSYKHYPSLEVDPVTPKHVEKAIKDALQLGWQPDKKGLFHIIQEKNKTPEIFSSSQT